MLLTDLSDAELVSRLSAICVEGHQLLGRQILHLIEVEERRLHLSAACTSMFDFCVRRLGMSEGEAYRRINAARLVRRFPSLLGRIERGEIHLSALALIGKHLDEANVDELVGAVVGKTKVEIQELLARRAPRPDAPSMIRKLPAPAPVSTASPLSLPSSPTRPAKPPKPAQIEPLAEARYKVQLTASAELREKLERARDLMRHRNPSGDLAVVVERALDALLEKLEKERLGKASRPRQVVRAAATSGRIPRAVRREVFARDGEQCSFVDGEGRRCPARGFLELDHIESRALGGSDAAANLRVRCRPHNLLHAEEVFGKEHVAQRVHLRHRRQRKSPAEVTAREPFDVAARGLLNMGFRESEVERALVVVSGRHPSNAPTPAVQEILREALEVLT